MIPKECKRLAEVDFPIAKVGASSLAEKARRMGTPHQLHLWWAWRPLAACRAMLLALLLPDPCDNNCPEAFKESARKILSGFAARPQRWDTELESDSGLRKALLHEFIADFADWDNSSVSSYIKTARALVKAAHGDDSPLVVDPFAGGGSIPLEALRLGCAAFGSDLNPVACLISKAKLADIQRIGHAVAERLNAFSKGLRASLVRELHSAYPPDHNGATPIAYLWARTVRCETPNCGAEIPLIRSAWLSKKAGRQRALEYIPVKEHGHPRVNLRIVEPKSGDVQSGTVSRAKATCPCCNKTMLAGRVKEQLRQQRGGADCLFNSKGERIGGARMIAVVTVRPGEDGREYRSPTDADYRAIHAASVALHRSTNELDKLSEPLPPAGTLGFRVQPYGMTTWGDLFNSRQKLSLLRLANLVSRTADAQTRELLALVVSKLAERTNSICDWMVDVECPGHLFTQQIVPPAWDYAESVPTCDSSGSFVLALKSTAANAATCVVDSPDTGSVELLDARELSLPDESAAVLFTDPPYYDAVPYADLSDFFFVWLKRALPRHPLLKDPYDPKNPLTPKLREAVQDESKFVDGHPKDRDFFEAAMAAAFTEGKRVLAEPGVGCVVFAHQTTEGWEALLSGMIRAKLVITSSWPIATERSARMRARDSAALATSIHLVCRPRPENAGIGDWGEIIRELPKRVREWMNRLSDEGIRGADLVFACIGPALELFSRHSRVETPDGEEVGLAANDGARGEPARRGYLSYVWEVAGRTALNQVLGSAESRARNGAAGALEEDARLTALFLWTLQATESANGNGNAQDDTDDDNAAEDDGGDEADGKGKKKRGLTLIFDVARRFAQPLGIHLDAWEGRIIETSKGIVRLLPVHERAKQLFGEEGASAVAKRFDSTRRPDPQLMLDFLAEQQRTAIPEVKGRGRKKKSGDSSAESLRAHKEATTLDRVHAAMLLQSSGASNALRALLQAETQRGPDFLRLANALSALYPRDSEEKRLLDAMLLAVPR